MTMNSNNLEQQLLISLKQNISDESLIVNLAKTTSEQMEWYHDWVERKGKAPISKIVTELEKCCTLIESYSILFFDLQGLLKELNSYKLKHNSSVFYESINHTDIGNLKSRVNVGKIEYDLKCFVSIGEKIVKQSKKVEKARDKAISQIKSFNGSNKRIADELAYFSLPFINGEPCFSIDTLLDGLEQVKDRYTETHSRDKIMKSLKGIWVATLGHHDDRLCQISRSSTHPFFEYAGCVLNSDPDTLRKSYGQIFVKE